MTKLLLTKSGAPGNGAAVRWWRMLAVPTGVLGSAVVLLAAPAHADIDRAAEAYADRYAPAVCGTLDDGHVSAPGLAGIANAIVQDGLSPFQAGEVIGRSVRDLCPWHAAAVFHNMPEAEYWMKVFA